MGCLPNIGWLPLSYGVQYDEFGMMCWGISGKLKMPLVTCTVMIWKWWDHGFVFLEEEITVKNTINATTRFIVINTESYHSLVLMEISIFLIVISTGQNYDVISVRHQRVVWMSTKREKIPALGASAYLLVCRRHATLLALCNTHSGWRGAGGVWVVLTVASCPSAAAQHVTPLDHIAPCCATIGACPFPCPISGATGGHHCGPSPCGTGGLGHEHGHTPCCPSSHRDS